MFGASTPQIAMLPLVAVLVMTGIKDGLEDWRRARLDDEVNNSAATKLGSWKNVNQPTDPRTFMERLFRMGNGMFSPQLKSLPHLNFKSLTLRGRTDASQPSKGVQKLRKAEAQAGMEIIMQRKGLEDDEEAVVEGLMTPKLDQSFQGLGANEEVGPLFGHLAPCVAS
jgi:phospholipid-translocating ATPase